jgi:hypothetical protein
MRKSHLTSSLAAFCLAIAALPAAAQQSPSILSRVRSLLGQPPAQHAAPKPVPPKPAAPAPLPASPNGAVQNTQTSKSASPATSEAKPVQPSASPAKSAAKAIPAPAKPVYGPPAQNAAARTVESRNSGKPAGNPALKNVSASAEVPSAKGKPIVNQVKPSAAAAKIASSAPNPKSTAEPKVDVDRDMPTVVKTAAIEPVRENIARRDPFAPLITQQSGGAAPINLPPGKPGLMIGSLHIDGIVNGPNGMIAIVSNPQQHVYFLREGDHLYDGQVEHITMDGISFHQTGKDPFGNPVEREVAKRLNPSTPGEER